MSQKVIVIDDDIISQNILRSILAQAGYSVVVASDGDEGIKRINDDLPDLIILDIMMPGKDGGDVAAALKENPETKDIPIVFVSSLVQDEQSRSCGVDKKISFVAKPFNRETLLNEIKKCSLEMK
jgi:CheY-like chemotaxis protein